MLVARFDVELNLSQTREGYRNRTTDIENLKRRDLFRMAAASSLSAWMIFGKNEIRQ
jgi:hypothetical protein